MIEAFVTLCFNRRGIVALVFLLLSLFGCYCWTQLPLEAYPDIAPVTSQVITQVTGLAAAEVEQQITIPLERLITGTPGLSVMRSRSTFGLSLITVVFQDGIDSYWSRERLLERIDQATLPYGAQPGLDPLTSPIGEIYRYTLDSKNYTLPELSELQFWTVIPRMKQVHGVIEVTNFGGYVAQFSLELNPLKLAKYHLSFKQIEQAITENNASAGGGILLHGEQGLVIRGVGLIHQLADFEHIEVTQSYGVPVYVKDLGTVSVGHKERHGFVLRDGKPEAIEGIVQMLKGDNPSRVLKEVHAVVDELNHHVLPNGVTIRPYLDRSNLVDATVHTVSDTLFYGMTLVTVVLMLFLGSIRAALIVGITIPLALLSAFSLMYMFGISANLLSLGAIDFGIIVDGAVVVVENIIRRRELHEDWVLTESELLKSTLQVTQPIFFGILVIITAYSILFSFQQIEYKLFAPMAFAVNFALLGALAVALTLTPGLAYWAYRKPVHGFKNRLLLWLTPRYERLLGSLIGQTRGVIVAYVVTLMVVIGLGTQIGRDFLPYLDEGSIWLQVVLPPGISFLKADKMVVQLQEATLKFPEVKHIVAQLGRNEDGTDPYTFSHAECAITLKPYASWPSGMNKQVLIKQLAASYANIPGIHVSFTQPMVDGVLDKVAGAHSDLVVKVYGHDLVGARKIASSIVHTLKTVRGAEDVIIDQEPPLTELRIDVDRKAIARYGIKMADVMDMIQTGLAGTAVTQIYIEERSYDVSVRFPPETRNNPQEIGGILLKTENGAQITLAQVANIHFDQGPTTITHEGMRRQLLVRMNVRGRDLVSFIDESKKKIAQKVYYNHLDYEVVWGGQLENAQRAQARLAVIIPMLLGLMFVLLFYQFGNLRHPSLILLSVPLALVGGLGALLLRGMTLNVSSAVGFIALFGVVVLNAIIMISNLNRWRTEHHSTLKKDIINGARERLRPVLMTATVAAVGMVPAALNHGLGSDVQRPLATVIIGGLITATALTLILLPALYYLVEDNLHKWQQKRVKR
ncbi:MAG: CusA/CzcA family heavy metal efflux RND transporter [Gammaproteobacteria bacterium]|nr:CusA/CzcA family heavy metal efflux RND transporter [Gammaproteobacteria bacterium]